MLWLCAHSGQALRAQTRPGPFPCAVLCWGSNRFGQASPGWACCVVHWGHTRLEYVWQSCAIAQRAATRRPRQCAAALPLPSSCAAFILPLAHDPPRRSQCGTGRPSARGLSEPTPVVLPPGAAHVLFDQVKAGDRFTCAHSTAGELFCFGGATAEGGRECRRPSSSLAGKACVVVVCGWVGWGWGRSGLQGAWCCNQMRP